MLVLLLLSLLDHNPQLLLDQKLQSVPNNRNPQRPLPVHDPHVLLLEEDSEHILPDLSRNPSAQGDRSTPKGTVQARPPPI
jgi:hypothetical protein